MLLLLPFLAAGAEFTICGSGCDFTSVDAAAASSSVAEGDLLWLEPSSTPHVLARPLERSLHLRGRGGPANATLRPPSATSLLASVGPGETLILEGVRVEGAGRLFEVDGGTLEIRAAELRFPSLSDGANAPDALVALVREGSFTLEQSTVLAPRQAPFATSAGGLIRLAGGELSVRDSQLAGGSADFGGVISVQQGASAVLDRVHIAGGVSARGGGVVVTTDGSLVARRSVFAHNRATVIGGGLAVGQGTTARVYDSLFAENELFNPLGGELEVRNIGGAIACVDCALHLTDSQLAFNFANGGAGLLVDWTGPSIQTALPCADPAESLPSCAPVKVARTSFFENEAAWAAGVDIKGRNFGPRARAELSDVRFTGNTVNNTGGGLWAGNPDAMRDLGPPVQVARAVFDRNRAGSEAGGMFLAGSTAGSTVTDALFCGNHAQDGAGGGAVFVGDGVQALRLVTHANTSGMELAAGLSFADPPPTRSHQLVDSLLAYDRSAGRLALLSGHDDLVSSHLIALWEDPSQSAFEHLGGGAHRHTNTRYARPGPSTPPLIDATGTPLALGPGSSVSNLSANTWGGVAPSADCEALRVVPPPGHPYNPSGQPVAGPGRALPEAGAWLDRDGDGAIGLFDCDDADPSRHPGAQERCNGVDDDCDRLLDELDPDVVDAQPLWLDVDRDGFPGPEPEPATGHPLDPSAQVFACAPFAGFAFAGEPDCDDNDVRVSPDAEEVLGNGVDDDCDPSTPDVQVDADGDGWLAHEDCDDNDADVFPGAPETCDGVDEDCDGDIDEGALDAQDWSPDQDGDGFGADAVRAIRACEPPSGLHVPNADDCDDTDADTHPGALETCDGSDDDCDGQIDEDAFDAATWYPDADGDSWGVEEGAVDACARPGSAWAEAPGDCDDVVETVHPGVSEVCDGLDNDCDGTVDVDATDATAWYRDRDGDGHGDPTAQQFACEAPEGAWVEIGDDCDDTDPALGAPPCEPDTGDTDSGDTDSGDSDSDSGDSDSGDSDDTDPTGPIVAQLTGGAGCAHAPAPLGTLGLIAVAFARRRRSAPR